jgi:hypothetical protein
VGPNNDYSPALLSSVHLPTCWALGAADAATILTSCRRPFENMSDPDAAPGCGVSVTRNGTTWKPVHQCKLLGGAALSYSLASAAKFANSAPCTNRPIQCPVQGCNSCIWSYSMDKHFAEKHVSREGCYVASAHKVPTHLESARLVLPWLTVRVQAARRRISLKCMFGCIVLLG